ncbi:glutamate racemase, partial [Thermodesulfobacteriota bacterium]
RRIVKKYLHPLKTRQVDTLILGCTHYPLLKETIQQKIGKRVRVIDSSIAVVQSLEQSLGKGGNKPPGTETSGTFRVFVSDVTEQFEKTAQMILKRRVTLEPVQV